MTRIRCVAADYIVDIGPGAGEHGGEVVAVRYGRGDHEESGIDHRCVS